MIAIIGGGISGLALAHALAERQTSFTLFERAPHAGGVIQSAVVDGHLLELGPQRTRMTTAFAAMVDDLGIAGDVVTAPPDLPLFVYHSGRLRSVPFSASALVRSDLLSPLARLRALLEPLTGAAVADETVAHYFTRKLGRAAYENLAGPLYGGLYASDPADMIVGLSLSGTLRDLGIGRSLVMRALRGGGRIAAPPACSFTAGMQTLTDALYARHRASIRTGVEVTGITRTGSGFEIETSTGRAHASQVVVATRAAEAAALTAQCAPAAAAAIAQLRYNPLAVVHLVTDAAVPRALGYQVGLGEQLITRGVTFNHALFGRTGVYTAYLGGARHADVVQWDDGALGAAASDEFRHVTGATARVVSVTRTAMPAWDRTWRDLAVIQVTPIDGLHFCANWESRPGLPGRLLRAAQLATTLSQRQP